MHGEAVISLKPWSRGPGLTVVLVYFFVVCFANVFHTCCDHGLLVHESDRACAHVAAAYEPEGVAKATEEFWVRTAHRMTHPCMACLFSHFKQMPPSQGVRFSIPVPPRLTDKAAVKQKRLGYTQYRPVSVRGPPSSFLA